MSMLKMREHSSLSKEGSAKAPSAALSDLEKKAAELRLSVLQSIVKAGVGATGACMSVMEIVVAIYYGRLMGKPVMNINEGSAKAPSAALSENRQRCGYEDQDIFFLSKWKAAPVLYAILADLGFFDTEEMNYLAKDGALLSMKQGAKIPGCIFSNFESGHGLSIALGLALSISMDRKNNRVFTVIDGDDSQSGQMWEAVMAASHYKLDNLICFIDNSKIQGSFLPSCGMDIGAVQDKFEAFGWSVIRVRDGHDFDQLFDAISRAFTVVRRPVCIWCHTVVGKGIDFAEGKISYQDVPLSATEMEAVLGTFV